MHLTDVLRGYGKLGIYPMHMPGHKRNPSFFSLPSPYEIDFTEVEGLDMLHDAQGILLDGMRRAAGLYGSSHTFYLVNGSTCGILSGITSCTRKGDRILVARNCHQSVYNAIGLQDLQAVYLLPEPDLAFGIWGSVSPAQVKRALDQYQDIRLIVLTSPTYEGVVSDISAIAKLSHERGIPLLVDEAHGAHLGFSPKFPQNSVQAGADLVIHSLHKTLPAPTQAALIHINGTLVDPEQVRRQLAVFETSSPSYVLMA
ncbi:MAG: aminotransferase class I/II-fold pyridoxal phosphate-dependent enzyme, partial [Oscillospiraceae bacterium]|nr:aminotransferase class I/II-fold pyridoxal phosphate-dependent enzyme [Oscillospiraceae bacterium]